MAQKNLSELSTEALIAREKSLKISVAVMAVAILFMIAAGAYLTFRKGFNTFTVLPVVFFGVMGLNVKNLKDIKKEIASRNA